MKRKKTHEDKIIELLHLHACLERQLQLGALHDDVREVEQVHFERVKHALAGDDDLLRLLFDRERTNQCGHFFGSLPLGELPKTFLTSPDTGVNDFEEELSRAWVEDEDSTVYIMRLAQ